MYENPVQQFQRVAKRSLAQLKIWSKKEFESKKMEQDELIEQLKKAKQKLTQAVEKEKIKKLEN